MKKTVLYCVAASILGVTLIVSPLLAIGILGLADKQPAHLYIHQIIQEWTLRESEMKPYGSTTYSYSGLDIEVFALCFFIALAVYLLFKRIV